MLKNEWFLVGHYGHELITSWNLEQFLLVSSKPANVVGFPRLLAIAAISHFGKGMKNIALKYNIWKIFPIFRILDETQKTYHKSPCIAWYSLGKNHTPNTVSIIKKPSAPHRPWSIPRFLIGPTKVTAIRYQNSCDFRACGHYSSEIWQPEAKHPLLIKAKTIKVHKSLKDLFRNIWTEALHEFSLPKKKWKTSSSPPGQGVLDMFFELYPFPNTLKRLDLLLCTW